MTEEEKKERPTSVFEQHVLDLSLPQLREIEDECRRISPQETARMNLEQGEWDRSRHPNNPNLAKSLDKFGEEVLGVDQVGMGVKIEFKGAEVTSVTAGVKAAGIVGAAIQKNVGRPGALWDLEFAELHKSNSYFFRPDNPADDLPTDGADIEAAKRRADMELRMRQPISEYDSNPVCAAIPIVRPGRNR